MGFKQGLIAVALALGLTAGGAAQAASVELGTYVFDTNNLVSDVTGFGGGLKMYDGTNYVDPELAPATITDSAGWTFLSTMPYPNYNNVSLDLAFGNTNVVNGDGSDLALFFLFKQLDNNNSVTINGTTQTLSYAEVFDSGGIPQVANGVTWNGGTLNNVLLLVAELDLDDFGVARGGYSNSLTINMNQTDPDPLQVVALSLVGALNTSVAPPAEIPVPAAVWLFGTGLIGLVGIARRSNRRR